jgi:hypothetical protein
VWYDGPLDVFQGVFTDPSFLEAAEAMGHALKELMPPGTALVWALLALTYRNLGTGPDWLKVLALTG